MDQNHELQLKISRRMLFWSYFMTYSVISASPSLSSYTDIPFLSKTRRKNSESGRRAITTWKIFHFPSVSRLFVPAGETRCRPCLHFGLSWSSGLANLTLRLYRVSASVSNGHERKASTYTSCSVPRNPNPSRRRRRCVSKWTQLWTCSFRTWGAGRCSAFSYTMRVDSPDPASSSSDVMTLWLEFTVDDTTPYDRTVVAEFHTPTLQMLSMPCSYFRDSYVEPFPQTPMPPLLAQVALSKYGPQHPPFALVDLLRCLISCKILSVLALDELNLDCSYTGPPIFRLGLENILTDGSLHFADMSGRVIHELDRLLDYPYVDSRNITRCVSTPDHNIFGGSYSISLEDIADPASLFSFLAAIQGRLSCNAATIRGCDGLQDSVLRMLSKPISGADPGLWFCQRLEELRLKDCRRFTSAELRNFVKVRRDMHTASGFAEEHEPGFTVTSVTALHVEDCCELEEGDKEWFDANVDYVCWDGWHGEHECVCHVPFL